MSDMEKKDIDYLNNAGKIRETGCTPDTWTTIGEAFNAGGSLGSEAAPFRIHSMEHGLTKDKVKETLSDTGAGGAVTNCMWGKGWNFNPENLKALDDTVHEIRAQGLRAWLYDEDHYPSGWAYGYIMKDGDRHLAKNIGVVIKEGSGAGKQTVELPEDGLSFMYAACYTKPGPQEEYNYEAPSEYRVYRKELNCETPEGEWQILAFYVRWCNVWPYAFAKKLDPPIGPREHLNFLEKDAVATYIEGALQTVADAIPDFGECFDAIFTDEPALQSIYIFGDKNVPSFRSVPYGSELFDMFKQTWGYDLRPALPYLFFSDTVQARTVRIQYYRVIAALMRKNFTGQVAEWCGDYMEVMDKQDWTGCDMLEAWPGQYWVNGQGVYNGGPYLPGKYASSVSRGKGHNITMAELCPVTNQELMLKDQATIHECFMRLTTFLAFSGITHINSYGYAFNHVRENFHRWNIYAGRLFAVLRYSSSDAKIGVYYPVADVQASMYAPDTKLDDLSMRCKEVQNYMENLMYDLYLNRHDFNIITERMICSSTQDGGEMVIGSTSYKVILIPDCRIVPLAAMKKLEAFVRAGGIVHFLDRLPEMGITMEEHAEVKRIAEKISGGKADELRPGDLALGAKVTASPSSYSPDQLTDGNTIQLSWDCWRSEGVPAGFTIHLGKETEFNRIDVYSKGDYCQKQYSVYVRKADGPWTELISVKDNDKYIVIHEFPLVNADEIRFVFEYGSEKQPDIAGLTAVKVYRIRSYGEPGGIMEKLHEEVCDPLEILSDASVFVSRYRRAGAGFYFLINPSEETEHIRLRDKEGRPIRIYDVNSGETSEGKEPEFDIAPGRGVFAELR